MFIRICYKTNNYRNISECPAGCKLFAGPPDQVIFRVVFRFRVRVSFSLILGLDGVVTVVIIHGIRPLAVKLIWRRSENVPWILSFSKTNCEILCLFPWIRLVPSNDYTQLLKRRHIYFCSAVVIECVTDIIPIGTFAYCTEWFMTLIYTHCLNWLWGCCFCWGNGWSFKTICLPWTRMWSGMFSLFSNCWGWFWIFYVFLQIATVWLSHLCYILCFFIYISWWLFF